MVAQARELHGPGEPTQSDESDAGTKEEKQEPRLIEQWSMMHLRRWIRKSGVEFIAMIKLVQTQEKEDNQELCLAVQPATDTDQRPPSARLGGGGNHLDTDFADWSTSLKTSSGISR